MVTTPVVPTRQELERLAGGDNRLLVALEQLFLRVGVDFDNSETGQTVSAAALGGKIGAARALAQAAVVAALSGGGNGRAVRNLADAAMMIAAIPERRENPARDYIDLRVAPSVLKERRLRWQEDGAEIGGLGDVALRIGRDVYVYGLNSSGVTISKGQGIMDAGSNGGDTLLQRAVADGSQDGYRVLGLAAHDIPDGEYGYVLQNGVLTGVNTSGFAAGAWLFFDSTTAGALTQTRPTAPALRSAKAKVISSAANGSVLVKVQDDLRFGELGDVNAPAPADGNVARYDAATQTWVSGTATVDLGNYELEDLGNVTAGTPNAGDVLYHTGSNWARLGGNATGSFTAGSGETVSVFNGFITSIV